MYPSGCVPYLTQFSWIDPMMLNNLESTSSAVQEIRPEFWHISKPEVATPPALDAFPGAYKMFADWKTITASGLVGMLAPSATHIVLFATNALASLSASAF